MDINEFKESVQVFRGILQSGEKQERHEYRIPEDPQAVIEAFQWMLAEYDDVTLEIYEDYGAAIAIIIGIPRTPATKG